MQLTEVDLYSPDTYIDRVPHDVFKLLRRESPVHWHREASGPGYWALTKYDDIVAVSQDSATFSSARMGTNIDDPSPDGLAMLQTIMLNMDPPRHTVYRRLVATGFTPSMIRKLEPHVRAITTDIVDRVARSGECDFVTAVAAELPLQVITEMVGVPHDDRHKIFDWSNRLIGFDDPEMTTSPEDGQRAATELFLYAHQLAAQRRDTPRDDLVSVLLQAEVDGAALSEPEFDAFFLLLCVAGNETTRNLISGAMRTFIEHPHQRRRLIDDPALMPLAVEEMLRWVSPLIYFRRTATRDTEIRGQRIREGDKVVMYYPSANRDEEIFDDADTFDVGRAQNPHVAFGGGGHHFCLGASLARLEIKVMFEEIFRRLPDIELAGEPRRLRSNFINGLKHLPVRYTPERA
ncbi:MAG TPA: cytochrome P450 [Dehalococcoidia bacterium]|nr:cytochrome P450 [Dehalococcoidia bacterium]